MVLRIAVLGACLGLAAQAQRNSFEPGQIWLDTEGKPIQAHSAGILVRGGVYYWYGEDKTFGAANKVGVSCYSSRDLYNWKREGTALPKEALPEQFRDTGVCERAKVLFNARTGKYVMWMHLDAARYTVSEAGVAVADKPEGPFRFVRSFRPFKYDYGYKPDCCNQRELGNTYRDMNLFLDDDGRAYVFYASEHNRTMYVARLNADFTGIEEPAELGKTWARVLIDGLREAPAPFKYKGKYYLFTSGCTGWEPNKATISVASNPLGPYVTAAENPMAGPDADLTFRSQSTFVLPVAGKPGAFILMLDRWNPKQLSDSRYVWLPFRVGADGAVRVEWRDRWNLSVFDTMQSGGATRN